MGLSGGTDNLYATSVFRPAIKNGFKVVIIAYRGVNLPISTPKFYCSCCWRDLKEPIDYLHEKFCQGNDRKIYGYGVSLGALMLNKYMMEDNTGCKLSGCILYGTPFDPKDNANYFKSSGYGTYDFLMGSYYANMVR